MFFIEDRLLSFAIFGGAHGIQYYIMLAFMTPKGAPPKILAPPKRTSKYALPVISIALLAGGTWLAWGGWQYVLSLGAQPELSSAMKNGILGAAIGFSLVHYHVDSKIWRMRDEKTRTFIAGKLPFLFN